MKSRLVTRSDFDGLVCAVLLKEMNLIDDIKFVHPKEPVNLRLQDHTDAVSFRNIWVQDL